MRDLGETLGLIFAPRAARAAQPRTGMSDLILHHYAASPFSEKVRLVLGMKGLRWRSVTVPMIMPKPDVVALTGGYRRTPFMQIGADVYCDSALMCRVIDRLAPEPPLYPRRRAGLAEIVAQWADSTLFWTAVPFTMQPAGVAHIFAGAPPEALKAFGADRAAMIAVAAARAARTTRAAAARRRTSAGSSACSPTAGRSCSATRRRSPTSRRRSRSGSCAARRRSRRMLEPLPRASAPGSSASRRSATAESTPMASAEAIALAAHGATATRRRRVDAGAGLRRRRRRSASPPSDYAHDEVAGSAGRPRRRRGRRRARRRARRHASTSISRASASTSRPIKKEHA